MIGMMERTAAILSFQNLPDGKATVGFEVCVKHVAAAAEGATCTVTAKLREIADERKLRFDVEVKEGDRTIGVGTHERRVIDVGGSQEGTSRPAARLSLRWPRRGCPSQAKCPHPRGRAARRVPERARGDPDRATRCG